MAIYAVLDFGALHTIITASANGILASGSPVSYTHLLDNNLLIANVSMTPNIMTPVNISVDSKEPVNPVAMLPTKNMDIMEIIVGKRPLQGTKLLVSIAIIRSLGESMILQPTTPAALQPNPIPVSYTHLDVYKRQGFTSIDSRFYQLLYDSKL